MLALQQNRMAGHDWDAWQQRRGGARRESRLQHCLQVRSQMLQEIQNTKEASHLLRPCQLSQVLLQRKQKMKQTLLLRLNLSLLQMEQS